jgi:curved DNA-binding protein
LPDHYRVLGVPRDADLATIRNAYRRLAKQFHPDLTASLPAEEHARADTKMREVNLAYDALTRDREGYDAALRRQESPSGPPPDTGPVARGQRPAGPTRGDDDVMAVTLDARERREGVAFTSGIDGEPILLPPGVEPGRHRLEGRGHFGSYGGPRGDLWVEVHVLDLFGDAGGRSRRTPDPATGGVGSTVARTVRVSLTAVLGVVAFLAVFLLWQRLVAG